VKPPNSYLFIAEAMYDKQETMDNLAWDRMDEHEENGKKQL